MTPALASALMPVARLLDPETAHALSIRALRAGLAGRDGGADPDSLATEALGLRFRNPVCLAAGFDKDAAAVLPLMRLGFGAVEVGTVTPRPQHGNPRPRLFRLVADRAVINRMGFNNGGLDRYAARLNALPRPLPAVLGANLGINKEGADPERDYPALYAAVAPSADYVTVNVSSPNTPGLRDLQGAERLASILRAMAQARAALPRQPPVLVKLAPDLAAADLPAIVEVCVAQGVAGLICSNTTLSRPPGLSAPAATLAEAGGLSGAPLRALSLAMLRRLHALSAGRLLLVGVGGIGSGADAYERIRAGASLVQVYSAFSFDGPALVGRIKRELAALLRRDGIARVADAVGLDAGPGTASDLGRGA